MWFRISIVKAVLMPEWIVVYLNFRRNVRSDLRAQKLYFMQMTNDEGDCKIERKKKKLVC